ncbi:amino acid adenylation domain-containing protein [Nannocystaceae bacterium ST9]
MASTARTLLRSLYELGAGLLVIGDRLQVRVPAGTLDAELEAAIVREREGILELVREQRGRVEALELPSVTADPDRRHEPFPLTDIQQAYWVGRGGDVELGTAIHVYLEIDGELDVAALSHAWLELVARHEMLRAIALADGRQRILAFDELPAWTIEVEDLSPLAESEREARLTRAREERSQAVLDISQWPPFAIRAAALGGAKLRLYFDIDCTFVDSWTVQLLFREWVALYRARVQPGAPVELVPPRFELSFRDYVLALDRPDLPAIRRARAYWDARIDSLHPAPALPLAKDPRTLGRPNFRRWVDKLPRPEWDTLAARAHAHGLTTPVLLIAAWAEVIALWAEAPEFTLNIPLFNRHPVHPEVVRLAGNFSSFTLLAVDARAGRSFAERAGRLREQLWRDLEHRFVSGVELLRRMFRREGGISGALMPVVFTSFASGVDGVEGSWVEYLGAELGELAFSLTQTPQVWLDHQVIEQPDGCFFNWDAAVELFPAGMIDEMFACYRSLLAELAGDPQAWTRATPSLAADLRRAPELALAAEPSPPRPRRLESRVFEQAARTPDALAVIAGDDRLSYAELAARSLALASKLHRRGSSSAPIAVVLDKGWRQVVAVLAILRAGSTWLPIDAGLPPARLAELLLAARVERVVTRAGLYADADWPSSIERIELGERGAIAEPDELPTHTDSQAIAVAIYTSGSTGAPKAALLTHAGLANAVDATIERFAIGPDDVCLALTALHHDMSIFDMFGPLAVGGRVVIPEPEARRDPGRWIELIAAESVSVWNSVPAMMAMQVAWLESRPEIAAPTSLRLAFLGGDWIPVDLPDRLRRAFGSSCRPVSVGGPTETSLWNIWFPIDAVDPSWTSIPYGTPLPNTRYWVMREGDAAEDLVERPTWVPGELCCTGVGIGHGYLGDDEDSRARSAAKFVRHPRTGEPMVRTGDRGRRLPDGTIEFLGRIDDQLSIGGFRIEPAEIEAALVRHPQVRACAVVAHGSRHDQRLVAHVVAGSERPDPSALQAHLAARLPEHMVPRSFVLRDELPVTRNGKLDRRALAAEPVEIGVRSASVGKPDSPKVAASLIEIVREVVGIDEVDPAANFFELGAHSVHLVRIHAELHRRIGLALPLVDLFKHPTVAFLSEHLARHLAQADGQAVERHELDQLRARLDARAQGGADSQGGAQAIAIVGMAGRFPGAADVDAFWANIVAGREAVRRLDEAELRAAGIPEQVFSAPDYVRAAALLDDIDQFDAALFGITDAEARLLDPQNRLLLEHAWEALEDAGWAGESSSLRVGVYAGKSVSNYVFPALDLSQPIDYFKRLFGNDKDFITSSISYHLDLRGPSVAIHTACSTSLVAVAVACQSLCAGDCDLALAGGVSVKLPHHAGYRSIPGDGMFAPDGHCRPFDAEGGGIVPGSGSGIVALRRLADAERDGDHVYAVIRGWATNNDGGHKVGFSAPDVAGQAEVIASAHRLAGVVADEISYVEAHGTGTPVGDPIEVEALRQAFRLGSDRSGYCTLGSVKAIVGHLDSAAGIAGLIKTSQALAHRTLPPSVNFTTPNPRIDFAATPFVVESRAREWPGPRRVAGVSSFGVGGTNAHLVLEQAPEPAPRTESVGPARARVVALSAKSDEALATRLARLAAACESESAPSLADLAFTSNLGRRHFDRRVAWVGDDTRELAGALASGRGLIRGKRPARADRRVAWLFSGFGDQRVGMGRELYEHESSFRAALDRCAAIARDQLELPNLVAALYPDADANADANANDDALARDLVLAQVGLFCVEWSLACLLQDWGLQPDVVLGHSLGEYVAACVAGVFDLADALRLVAARARLIEARSEPGETWQIKASRPEVEDLLAAWRGELQVASHNGPRSVVVSGRAEAMAAFVRAAQAGGHEITQISARRAAHSPLMEPVLEAFAEVAATVHYRAPRIELVGNLGGELVGDEIATPDYWVRQLREPVRLAECFATLHERAGVQTFIELGPTPALVWNGMQCVPGRAGLWLPTLRPPRPEREQLLALVGQLYVDGVRIDWARVHAGDEGRRVRLPTYPFERRRHWIEGSTPAIWPARLAGELPVAGRRSLLGTRLDSPALPRATRVWESTLDQPWLADHRVDARALVPGAAMLELLRAAACASGLAAPELVDPRFERPLAVAGTPRIQTIVRDAESSEGELDIELHAQGEAGWTRCAKARARASTRAPRGFSLAQALAERGEPLDPEARYRALAERGQHFGPSFRGIVEMWSTPTGALARVVAPASIVDADAPADDRAWHPALLDACLQVIGVDVLTRPAEQVLVPAAIASIGFGERPSGALWVLATRRDPSGASFGTSFDVDVIDESGRALLELRRLELRVVERERLVAALAVESSSELPSFELAWQPTALARSGSREPGRWLLIGVTIVDELADRLRAAGHEVECVATAGAAAARLARASERPSGVVQVFACASEEPRTSAELLAAQAESCGALVELVGALVRQGVSTLTQGLWIASMSARSVDGSEPLAGLIHAPLAGVSMGVALELPGLACRSVDLDARASSSSSARLLADELLAGDLEPLSALRGEARFVARLRARALPASAAIPTGAWLIAGGTGRVGRAIARWLASAGVRELVIVSRRGADSALADELAALGARVEFRAADLADDRAIAALEPELRERSLAGIIHAAGVIADGPIAEADWARFAEPFASKIAGAWNLARLAHALADVRLILLSSSASILPEPGQANYAAANLFLDELARRRGGLALGYGPWGGDALAVADPRQLAHAERRGLRLLDVEQALAGFARSLASTGATTIAAIDWAQRERWLGGNPLSRLLPERAANAGPPARAESRANALVRELDRLPTSRRRERLSAWVRAEVADVLGITDPSALDVRRGLTELGIDSLAGLQLRNRLQELSGRELPVGLIYLHPSVAALSDWLAELLGVDSPRAPTPSSLDRLEGAELAARLAELLDEVEPR